MTGKSDFSSTEDSTTRPCHSCLADHRDTEDSTTLRLSLKNIELYTRIRDLERRSKELQSRCRDHTKQANRTSATQTVSATVNDAEVQVSLPGRREIQLERQLEQMKMARQQQKEPPTREKDSRDILSALWKRDRTLLRQVRRELEDSQDQVARAHREIALLKRQVDGVGSPPTRYQKALPPPPPSLIPTGKASTMQ